MRTLLSLCILFMVSMLLIQVTGCSNPSKVTPTEIKDFKGGGPMPAQAQELMKEHAAAFAKSHPRTGAPDAPIPSTGVPTQ